MDRAGSRILMRIGKIKSVGARVTGTLWDAGIIDFCQRAISVELPPMSSISFQGQTSGYTAPWRSSAPQSAPSH